MEFKRKFLICVISGVFISIGLYLYLNPVSTSPVKPVPSEVTADNDPYAENNLLSSVELFIQDVGFGPDDVTMGPDGYFYTGLQDGRIVKFTPDGKTSETFVNTDGRSYGLEFDSKGNLIVADAIKGLLSISPDKTISILTVNTEGERLSCPIDLDIAEDNTIWVIYMLEANQRLDLNQTVSDFKEYWIAGRLLSYNPETKETKVHLENLMSPHGVALGPDDNFVLVSEGGRKQVTRLWLKGSKSGQQDIFISNLPINPISISFNGRDIFWVTFSTPYSCVIGLSPDGEVVHNFQGQDGVAYYISSANEYNGNLYL